MTIAEWREMVAGGPVGEERWELAFRALVAGGFSRELAERLLVPRPVGRLDVGAYVEAIRREAD